MIEETQNKGYIHYRQRGNSRASAVSNNWYGSASFFVAVKGSKRMQTAQGTLHKAQVTNQVVGAKLIFIESAVYSPLSESFIVKVCVIGYIQTESPRIVVNCK